MEGCTLKHSSKVVLSTFVLLLSTTVTSTAMAGPIETLSLSTSASTVPGGSPVRLTLTATNVRQGQELIVSVHGLTDTEYNAANSALLQRDGKAVISQPVRPLLIGGVSSDELNGMQLVRCVIPKTEKTFTTTLNAWSLPNSRCVIVAYLTDKTNRVYGKEQITQVQWTGLPSNTWSSAPVTIRRSGRKVMTQEGAIRQLMNVFGRVQSDPRLVNDQIWPTGLKNSLEPKPYEEVRDMSGIIEKVSDFVGLRSVFPGATADAYPYLLGMVPQGDNVPVTAGEIATWIVNWAQRALGADLSAQPYSNPYDLATLYSLLWGTNFKGPRSLVTSKDMLAIRNDIIEVSRGWRVLGSNQVQMLAPLREQTVARPSGFVGSPHLSFTKEQLKAMFKASIEAEDSTTLRFKPDGEVVANYKRVTGWMPNITEYLTNGKGGIVAMQDWVQSHEDKAFAWANNGASMAQIEALWKAKMNEPDPLTFYPNPRRDYYVYLSNVVHPAPFKYAPFSTRSGAVHHLFISLGCLSYQLAVSHYTPIANTPPLIFTYKNGEIHSGQAQDYYAYMSEPAI